MTNDEAIYTLKNTAFLGWSEQAEKVSEAVRMAVEALKTQLPKEGTTSDCISRQAAIDICNNVIDLWQGQLGEGALVAIKNAINNLPSVQPERTEERTETHACDCVSRQAAIRWVKTECNPYGKPTLDFESGKRVMEHLETMPSIQPDVLDTNVGDLISRQGAIDYCYQLINVEHQQGSDEMNYGQVRVDQTETILHHLEFMPSVQPYTDEEIQKIQELEQAQLDKAFELGREDAKPQWIPCRETVDIPDHEILACDKYGEEMFGYLSYEDDQWLCESDGYMMYDPIAWREKPEPYREGE